MGRPGDYLFKRKGSQNWWIRFQYTGRYQKMRGVSKVEFSLGTPNREEAEIKALDHISDHKRFIFACKTVFDGKLTSRYMEYEPNRLHSTPDGGSIYAHETMISIFDSSGALVRIEPNRKMVRVNFKLPHNDIRNVEPYLEKKEHPDGIIIEDWILQRGLNKHLANEAREVWRHLTTILNGRRLSNCTREHAKQLVRVLQDEGNKSATVDKKVGHLRAAVNFAIQENRMKSNPFNNVVPKIDDKLDRQPLSDDDMANVRRNLHKLSLPDQLLWKLLATTGMRLDEPFSIIEEFSEGDARYIIVGTKTKTSKRRVPLPTCILELLPQKIQGPLFAGSSETAGKRLRYFLKQLQISYDKTNVTGDKRKVVHSLRHRAKDRLRAVRCPEDVQYEILGHEVRTVASGYGRGYPVAELRNWIDLIGF